MKKKLWERRIPNGIALLLLLAGVFVSSYLIRSGIFIVSRASPDSAPHTIKVTNITDTSFKVAFSTLSKTSAALTVQGNGELGTVIFDDRDKTSNAENSYYSHEITVSNLKPLTSYSFSIIVNSTEYLNNGKQYVVKTGPKITGSPGTQKPLVGKIISSDGSVGSDVLLLVTLPHAQTISGISQTNGEYSIPVNSVRTQNLSSYLTLQDNTSIIINAIKQNSESQITILYKNANSIPTINLANNYDFSQQLEQTSLVATPSGALALPSPQLKFGTIAVTSPNEGQSFIDTKPLFQGRALPHEKVTITIHSDTTIQTSVISDQNGVWTYRPTRDLTPGPHTIIIQTPDQFGIIKQITRNFTVFASGSQLFQQSGVNPSITPTLTLTPTPTLTPTATLTSTPTPTGAETLTPTVEETPSATESATPTVTPLLTQTPTATTSVLPTITPLPTTANIFNTPTPTLAETGSNTSVVATGASFFLIITGVALLFFL